MLGEFLIFFRVNIIRLNPEKNSLRLVISYVCPEALKILLD